MGAMAAAAVTMMVAMMIMSVSDGRRRGGGNEATRERFEFVVWRRRRHLAARRRYRARSAAISRQKWQAESSFAAGIESSAAAPAFKSTDLEFETTLSDVWRACDEPPPPLQAMERRKRSIEDRRC